jgi:diacylglycerol kinase (ATP)
VPPGQPPPRRGGFLASFRHAYEGLLVSGMQRNMKFHIVSAVLVGLVGSGVRLGLAEKVSLIFCVLLVFFAEILNTALEALVDLHTQDFRELAKTTKDAAAAAVLVLAFGTVVIFVAICVHSWAEIAGNVPRLMKQAAGGIPLAIVVGTLLLRSSRPRWADHLVAFAGFALLGWLATFTVSTVFTVLTGALLWLAWRIAGFQRHR